MIGQRIAHYEVLDRLGRGGMGVVYRGLDTRLDRQVALKFLPDAFRRSDDALDRFVREAKSAAALNHPHICTIYEIGEHDGHPFIAMELLEGHTLAERIGGRPLPIGTSIELALHVASALEAAHAKGIVHRDIKPANVFVTSAGTAKVLDFGLAKTVTASVAGSPDSPTVAGSANLTGAGSTLGTIAYMSPEQARGQDLDARSDVFSLGLVLYEMVTGRQAFTGETTAVLFDAILNRMPPAPSEVNPDVPPELERVIAKAIEKDRDARYQSAGEMAADLRPLRRASDSGGTVTTTARAGPAGSGAWPSTPATATAAAAPAAPVRRSAIWTRVLPIAAVILILAGIAAWQLRDGTTQALAESDLILIADFENSTGDPVFDGTLKQALAVKLEESPFLNVVPEQRVRETLGFMDRPGDTPVTAAVAREMCQRQGIKAVMLGAIASLGSTYVVTLTAENCTTGDVLAREQATAGSKEEVLAALGSTASAMRGELGESLASIARTDTPIEDATTSSLEALKAYSLGDQKRNTSSDQEAIPFFRRAIELDPDFASAHAQLGTIYANLGQHEQAVEHRRKAYELRDRVSERERLYITAHYYNGVERNPAKALETYELWKQTYPRDPVPYINSGTIYSVRGEGERALEAYLKGLELDPGRRLAYTNAFSKLLQLDRVKDAQALVQRWIDRNGPTPDSHVHLYEIAARRGDRAAMEKYAAALEGSPIEVEFLAVRASEMAYYGQLREARRLMQRTIDLLKQQGFEGRVPLVMSGMAVTMAFLQESEIARQYAGAAEPLETGIPDVHVNLAFTYASLGQAPRARQHMTRAEETAFADAEVRGMIVNVLEALVALTTRRPRQSVDRLADLPLEREMGLISNALLVRAEAHAALEQWPEAERDYREVMNRQSGVFYLQGTLARIGLARVLTATGDRAGAKQEYENVLEQWKDADEELRLLREVKAEAAKVTD